MVRFRCSQPSFSFVIYSFTYSHTRFFDCIVSSNSRTLSFVSLLHCRQNRLLSVTDVESCVGI